jgi:replicative DNA helicase
MSDQPAKDRAVTTEERLAKINRALPFSDEAEKGLLSCLMQDPERIAEVRAKLPAEAFYHAGNRTLFEVMLEMLDKNLPVEPVSLTHRLRDQEKLERVGGAAHVSELYDFTPIAAHYPHYVHIMREKWALRQTIHACAESIDECLHHGTETNDEDITAVVGRAESRVFECVQALQASGEYSTGPVHARRGVIDWVERTEQTIANRGKIMGLETGILELDQTVHGLDDAQGEIVVIAGRPGQGKTAMATTLIHNLAVERNVPGLVFSAEMSSVQLYDRIILGGASIDTSKAITGMFSRADQDAMQGKVRQVQTAPLLISDGSAISTADIRSQVQVAKRQHGIRWIVVDHLHLIKAVSKRGLKDEREALVEVMETLQFVKKFYKLTVLLMVQLNRETDRNAGKPPVLADLSGSAAIEWYADHVWMLHRDPYFFGWHTLSEEKKKGWADAVEPRRERNPQCWSSGGKYGEEDGGWPREDYEQDAKIYVRKNRRGPTPELHMRFEDWRTWFSSRMPKLNSTDWRDWQFGSYAVPKKEPRSKPSGKSKRTDDGWDADFKD